MDQEAKDAKAASDTAALDEDNATKAAKDRRDKANQYIAEKMTEARDDAVDAVKAAAAVGRAQIPVGSDIAPTIVCLRATATCCMDAVPRSLGKFVLIVTSSQFIRVPL